MFGVDGIEVLAAGEVAGELHLLVQTAEQVQGCRECGWSRWRTGAGSTWCGMPRSGTVRCW